MFTRLAYLFLFSVILFGLYQSYKYKETLSLIINNADIEYIKHQAILDSQD